MKNIFILMVTFCMLLSFNANAGKNVNFNVLSGFSPKTEISDHKNTKKLKTIQKLLNTKLGKWVVKKAIKKLQKNHFKNDIKTKNKQNAEILNHGKKILIFGTLLFLVGIGLLIGGYTALGIILGVLGLLIVFGLIVLLLLIGRAFSRR